MVKTRILLLTLLILGTQIFAQETSVNSRINKGDFNETLFQNTLLDRLNSYRKGLNISELEIDSILQNASSSQADYMAEKEEVTKFQSGKMKTTEKRIVMFGGAPFGKEIVYKYNLKKSNEDVQTYQFCVNEIAQKWLNGKKTLQLLANPNFIFAGLSVKLSSNKRKIFISLVLGNYNSFKSGAEKIKDLDYPFSKKKCGVKSYDSKICKKTNTYKKLSLLQQGLSLEDGVVYFQTDDYKRFKKIVRSGKDGVALDIVQKKQYLRDGLNIVDNTTPWKGIVTKPVWASKLMKNNIIEGKEAKYKLKTPIAKLKNNYGEDIEMNLLIIQDKHVCANIMPNYLEDILLEVSSKVDFLADTITINSEFNYKPVAEKTELVFKVPFQKNKSNYKKSDIEPIINSLNEPDFIINKIDIAAYSSIEGRANSNKKLQKNRAESIEQALKTFIETQKGMEKSEVKTDENWADFCRDVKGTKYEYLSEQTLEQAKQTIKKKRLWKGLESILKKHRYASVRLYVTYNIKGEKEEKYVLSRFNKAVKENDKIKALSIQKYIFKKVLAGDYSHKAVVGQVIPDDKSFAGIKMNWYWLMKYINEMTIGETFCEKIQALYNLDSDNQYLMFNNLLCEIQYSDLTTSNKIDNLNKRLNRLYETKLPEQTIKNLQLEYLFSVIEAVDTLPQKPELAQQYLQKVKDLVNVEDVDWKNALMLSYLFMEHQDYNYSAILLEPFLDDKEVGEELVFTYISLATHSSSRVISEHFYQAVKSALRLNKQRLKSLFTSGRISVQVLENMKVKALLKKELNI